MSFGDIVIKPLHAFERRSVDVSSLSNLAVTLV